MISNKGWCIRTGERLCCKRQKNADADIEFCEGRQKTYVNEGNNLFFVESDILDKKMVRYHRIDINY